MSAPVLLWPAFRLRLLDIADVARAPRLCLPHLARTKLERDQVLYEPGDLHDRVYFIDSGIVSIMAVMRDGTTVQVVAIGYEGAIGLLSGEGTRRSHSRVLVQVSGFAYRIESSRYGALTAQRPALKSLALRNHEAVLGQVMQSVACNALHTVDARLCRWLLTCRKRLRSDLIPVTQETLASMLGVQRTTVTAAAQAVQATGAVRYRRGCVEILDPHKLHSLSCECFDSANRVDR